MRTLRKVLSVLLMLILVPLLWGQIAGYAVRSVMVQPDTFKQLIRESGLYTETYQVVLREAGRSLGQSLAIPDGERLLREVLPPSRVESIGDTLIDGMHQWLITGTDRPHVILPLGDLREKLMVTIGQEVQEQVANLPACTTEQLVQMQQSGVNGIPTCSPGDTAMMQPYIDQALATMDLSQIPDQLDLANAIEQSEGPGVWQEANRQLAGFRLFMLLAPWGWAAIGVLLLILALLNMDRWYTPFGWIAATLLLGGGLMFVIGISVTHLLLPFWRAYVPPVLEGSVPVEGLVSAMVTTFATELRNLALLISLIGLGSLILTVAGAILSPSRQENQPPAMMPPPPQQNPGMM